MPALVVRVRRGVLGRYLLGSLVFVAAGGWLLASGSVLQAVAGVLGLAFFGPMAAWFAVTLLRRRPALVVDERGVTDHSSPVAAGFLPWSQVRWVAGGGAYVQLGLHRPEVVLARLGPLARLLVQANARVAGGVVVRIPVALLGTTSDELSRAIAARAPDGV